MANDITIEDVKRWKAELEAEGIKDRFAGDLEVTEYDENHYRLSGSVWGIVPKKLWNDLLMEAAQNILAEGKGIEPLRKP